MARKQTFEAFTSRKSAIQVTNFLDKPDFVSLAYVDKSLSLCFEETMTGEFTTCYEAFSCKFRQDSLRNYPGRLGLVLELGH